MRISTRLATTIVLYLLFTVSLLFYVFYEKQIDESYENKVVLLQSIANLQSSLNCNLRTSDCLGIDLDIKKIRELAKDSNILVDKYGLIFNKFIGERESEQFSSRYEETNESLLQLKKFIENASTNRIELAKRTALYWRIVVFVLLSLLIFSIAFIYHRMQHILGVSFDTVHRLIKKSNKKNLVELIRATKAQLNYTDGKKSEVEYRLKNTEGRLNRLDNIYTILQNCHKQIAHCNTEKELFCQICQDAIEFGGMKFVWIGVIEGTKVVPIAYAGSGIEYVNEVFISIDESIPEGRGPTGTAIRNDEPFWCNDYLNELKLKPWHDRGKKHGWRSSCAIPIHCDKQVIGAIMFYSPTVNAFDESAQKLLLEMTNSIDHAVLKYTQQRTIEDTSNILRTILDTVPLRIFWKDKESVYLGCNIMFANDAGLESSNAIIGLRDEELVWAQFASAYKADDKLVMDDGQMHVYIEELVDVNSNLLNIKVAKTPLRQNGEIIGILGVYEDITKQKQDEERIQFLANYDPLTELPNRLQLEERFRYAISRAKQSGHGIAVMFLDLDYFKTINDNLGHSTGDFVLKEVAKRLSAALRDEDVVSRFGGDEFVLVLPGVSCHDVTRLALKIKGIISAPMVINDRKIVITPSIGIASYPDDGEDFESLLKSADVAMYRAKAIGRHTFCFFTKEMQNKSIRIMHINTALHSALDNDQIRVVFQPQITLNGKICGAEALIRWHHPEFGNIAPNEFIRIAEENGTIFELGNFVLQKSIEIAKIIQKTIPDFVIAVNLSAAQFHTDLTKTIINVIEHTKYDPKLLELELTETVAMSDPDLAIQILHELDDYGITLSIDDFGTGYSSLSYLKRFRVRKLKIDKSFIDDCNNDSDDKAIVNGVITMAKAMGLLTIAEGVETIEQLQYLKQIGCDKAQGYFISKPLERDDLIKFVQSNFQNWLTP